LSARTYARAAASTAVGWARVGAALFATSRRILPFYGYSDPWMDLHSHPERPELVHHLRFLLMFINLSLVTIALKLHKQGHLQTWPPFQTQIVFVLVGYPNMTEVLFSV
jgi:hypothetical protein